MEQKQKVLKWLSVAFLGIGFVTYVVYLFCRKPAGMAGTEYQHIGWFVVDVFMIGGALLGLIMPDRFEKLWRLLHCRFIFCQPRDERRRGYRIDLLDQ